MQMALKKIKKVFVDREDALNFLESELEDRIGDAVENAIRITQAPGTGKTRLLKEFIKRIEDAEKGIGIYLLNSDFEEWTQGDLNSLKRKFLRATLVNVIPEIKDHDEISFEYAEQLVKKYNLDYWAYKDLLTILNVDKPFRFLFKDFCKIVLPSIDKPLIVVIDEIQATIGVMTERFQNGKEQGLFREIIKMTADLIKIPNVLVIISGTNYKIMHFLEHLGSPLHDKTLEYNLLPLEPEYVGEFYDRVFDAPENDVEEKLRSWLMENSNGVPRTMVWMAEELQRLGGPKWAQEVGIEIAIKKLDKKTLDRIIPNVRKTYNDLVEFSNGRELLEWLVYRSMLDHQIPQVEFKYLTPKEVEEANYCTMDDLINKGIIHVVDDSVEIRNIYYEKALRTILGIENITFKTILDMSNINETELSGLLTWQRSILGAYLEMAVALGLFNLSKKTGVVHLNQFFDTPTDKDIEIQIKKIVRVPSIDSIIKKHELNVLYASPERGPDLTIFTENNVILIECKNWQRPLTEEEFDEIQEMFNKYRGKLGGKLGENTIKVLITTKGYESYTKNTDIHVISDENLKKIIGDRVFSLFESVRERARSVRPIAINVE